MIVVKDIASSDSFRHLIIERRIYISDIMPSFILITSLFINV
jgi:hypothetical protein